MPQLSSDIRFLDLDFVWSASEFNSSLDVCVVQFNPVNALIHATVICGKELNSVPVVFCVWLQIMLWIAWHGICLSCGETYQKIHWRLTRTSLYANTHPLVMMCGVEFKKIHSLLSTYYFCHLCGRVQVREWSVLCKMINGRVRRCRTIIVWPEITHNQWSLSIYHLW